MTAVVDQITEFENLSDEYLPCPYDTAVFELLAHTDRLLESLSAETKAQVFYAIQSRVGL